MQTPALSPERTCLQPVSRAELPLLTELARETFVITFGHLYTEENLSAYIAERLSLEGITREWSQLQTRFYLVRNDAGEALGYIKHIAPSTQYLEHVKAGVAPLSCSALLERFYLLPAAQGSGLAHRAMEAWLAALQTEHPELDGVHLSVWEENHRAQRFYQRYGFGSVGTFGYVVGDQVDTEYLYVKRFEGVLR